MKKSYFLFQEPTKLFEMLDLRRAGFSFNFLADLYGCDRTSLRYQCRKYQVFPFKTVFIRNDKSSEIFNPNRMVKKIITEINPRETSQWIIIGGEKVNAGKSYADYLSPYKNKIF
jgi:hypothetical protein